MAKEIEIVKLIDDSLKENAFSTSIFTGIELNGLCEIITSDKMQMIYKTTNETPSRVIYNDKHSLVSYHLQNSPSKFPETKNGYGNERGFEEISLMSMVVIYNSKRIKNSSWSIKTLLHSKFPAAITPADITGLKLSSCRINLISIDPNAVRLFARDHFDKNLLNPSVKMIEVQYELITSYGRDCIDSICCD